MNNLKKIGLTALAGSLVAFGSATAAELTVTGGAKLSYTNKSGSEDGAEATTALPSAAAGTVPTAVTTADNIGVAGAGFGMQHLITLSGSGELDNGMTASLMHTLQADGSGGSTSILGLDMGSMGKIEYYQGTGNIGLAQIDDVMPTAEEEVSNGTGIKSEHSATGTAESGTRYEASMGSTGFNYSVSPNDMMSVTLAYSPGGLSNYVDDGATSGTGDSKDSDSSIHVVVKPMDGLTVYAGTGEDGTTDQDVAAFTYAMGPFSVGYQWTEKDIEAANSATARDSERKQIGIAMAINENLSVSIGQIETELDGAAKDEESEGASIAYSMGGIALKAHTSKLENAGGVANNESEHTEVSVSFAF